MSVRAVSMVVALTLMAARPSAQRPQIDELMERVAGCVHRFVDQFSNVVAEEQFVPDHIRRFAVRTQEAIEHVTVATNVTKKSATENTEIAKNSITSLMRR